MPDSNGLNTSRLGTLVAVPSWIRGSRSSTGTIASARDGSNSHTRFRHHHHGQNPQHQRNLMSKLPLMSVNAQPTCCFVHHHQNQSTSYAHTSAPGTGLPSGHTTCPWMVNSRHQRHHHHHHQYETTIGSRASCFALPIRDPGTTTEIVCESASSWSSARSGPIRTRKDPGRLANENRAMPVPVALSFTASERSSPSQILTTTFRFCCFRSSAAIADASTGTSSVKPPDPAALSGIERLLRGDRRARHPLEGPSPPRHRHVTTAEATSTRARA